MNSNPQVNLGNVGGGRMKAGDVTKLLSLWDGKVKIEDIKVKERVIKKKVLVEVMKTISNKGKSMKVPTGKFKVGYVEEIERSFLSAYDAFCYDVLTGDRKSREALLDKLYADQRTVLLDDGSKPNPDKLKEYSNEELYKLRKQITEEATSRD